MTTHVTLEEAIEKFKELTHKPENYLSIQENIVEPVKDLTKSLYDFLKTEECPIAPAKALPELIIEKFDEEQIWQEIELQNDDRWSSFVANVSKFTAKKNDLGFPIAFNDEISSETIHNNVQDHPEDDNDSENTSNAEEEIINSKKKIKKTRKTSKEVKQKKGKGSIVDDKFFKLKELEEFLDAEDKKEMNKQKKPKKTYQSEDSSEDDEEEEIDLFENWDSDEGLDDDKNDKDIKYKDFFGGVSNNRDSEEEPKSDSELKNESDNPYFDDNSENEKSDGNELDLEDVKRNSKDKSKSVRFDMKQPSSSEDESEKSDSDNLDNTQKINPENMSEYQLRQQRLKKKIGHLENNLLMEKSWPMKGEVTGTTRPQNSLLEEIVDFDMTSRPAPIITEETTLKLQDIIIRRIKDKAWDDVERKIKPVEEVHEFKKQLVLDQEKSKLSLAQVYEQEFIKQREALDPDADEKPEEEPKEHVEIRKLMTGLFCKLDALCNFHYTPKVAAPDVKIISNMPAITMEEVAPVATSDGTLLAPEEIRAKTKGDIVGKSERTDTDKKRERRQKKIRQRERQKQREKREKVLDKVRPGLGNKYSREKASKLLDKVTKDRNVDKMETLGDGKSLKSSAAFFSQLQDEVTSTINSKLKPKRKMKNTLTAKQMKL